MHGGDTFKTYGDYLSFLADYKIDSLAYFKGNIGWQDTLQEKLGDDFEVIAPKMPNKINAKYAEWKIWFEKLIPLLNHELILIGYSLGGIFLAKYLSENIMPKKITCVYLVAAPHDETDTESLADFILPSQLTKLAEQAPNIHLYHSKDDSVVQFSDLEKYQKELPGAIATIFEDRGHFWQENFPELINDILK
ncbi:MAG: hypothetical protein RL641_662 [Candidatus Parcubacteria bacterium]|jgi:predicted alpha/beta hydrolase family esterase